MARLTRKTRRTRPQGHNLNFNQNPGGFLQLHRLLELLQSCEVLVDGNPQLCKIRLGTVFFFACLPGLRQRSTASYYVKHCVIMSFLGRMLLDIFNMAWLGRFN